ncbi:unnamed protein product [Rhizoctonia solani]|uniref:Fungal-type protein kinase domain-containing protein n=1 Tax=Rhizoctonia solani TaxID=456999 RepID=A0A8H3CUB8_9AGAM|nr:unnamed protein product [Rhizoctonia solani]
MSTRDSSARTPHRRVLTPSTNRKRKADSDELTNPTEAETSGRTVQIGSADTNTPFRAGSAQRSTTSSANSRSNSRSTYAYLQTDNAPAAAPISTQLNMDRYLEDEMRGAIFCDPHFVNNFLSVKNEQQTLLRTELDGIPEDIQNALNGSITTEYGMYRPILNVLQSIKGAVDTVRNACNLGSLGTSFHDTHTMAIPGDNPDTQLIKPDLVLFESDDLSRRHWETLMMPIEVKSKLTYRKVAMKQLARYARAVFAHQIHRRLLYGIVICKWAATFVRFDRSGIVHSEPIDMRHSPKEFRQAFAGLMMLDRTEFGYDPAFTTKYTPEAQLEYYVDLPAAAFLFGDTGLDQDTEAGPGDSDVSLGAASAHQTPISRKLPPRRFKVIERLCHRKSIRGRATIVLRLREVRKNTDRQEPGSTSAPRMTRSRTKLEREEPGWEEVPGAREYALKLMWRDPNKQMEGEILKQLEGDYGVVQCQWYSDILRWDANCHEPGATSCKVCNDVTPAQVVVQQANNLGDLYVQIAQEDDDKEPQYVEVDTDGLIGELYEHRKARIYSWALFSTVGKLLWKADTPREFLEAVLDAMLGYWQVVNRGILHRDISDGNVLIGEPGQRYDRCNWKPERGSTVPEDGQQKSDMDNHPLVESRRLAKETIARLGRDPSGFLSDFDLATTHSGMKDELHKLSVKKERGIDSRTRDGYSIADTGPDAKRLKRDEEPSDLPPNPSLATTPRHQAYKLIDFRTGTPTFMSARVLFVRVGTPYEHHFMDDLESFFWLIFWCVLQHTDPPSSETGSINQPTETAQELLQQLDRSDSEFKTLAMTKKALLLQCSDGGQDLPPSIVDELERCQNSWVTNPAIVHVIVKLGFRFYNLYVDRSQFPKCTPADEFPKLIGIIADGLKHL